MVNCSECENNEENKVENEIQQNSNKFKTREDIGIKEEKYNFKDESTNNLEKEKNKKSIMEKVIEKIKNYWDKMELFYRVESATTIIVFIFLMLAINSRKFLPIFITVIQIIGVTIAMLIHKEKIRTNKNYLKYIVLVMTIFCSIINIASYSVEDRYEDSTNYYNALKVDTPYSANDCIGKKYLEVENDFRLAGFTNITREVIADLEIEDIEKDDIIESVSINGESNFNGNTEYKSTAKIVIKYHSLKNVSVPMSSAEIETTEIETIMQKFKEAGFIKLNVDEQFDLDPDSIEVNFKNTININGLETFEQGSEFSMDSEIKIITHRPYEKYTVKIGVNCLINLILNRYNVEFEFGGETKILEHGKDAELEYRLKPGKYTGTFKSVNSSSVKGAFDLDVIGDTNASYKIGCYSDYISVENVYIENKGAVKEGEAMIPYSSYDCKYENYKDIEDRFKVAGFTNISTEILYDIYWGWTSEGEVESVSIDGNTSFNRGDIFNKDSKILITYHMKEEDNPNKVITNNVSETKQENNKENENSTMTSTNISDVAKINPPKSAAKAFSEYYKDIEEEFKNAGFTNINLEKVEDIKPTSKWNKEGEIKEISIDGKTNFKTTDSFNTDSKVIIKYHTYPTYEYTAVTVDAMIKDLEKNAANAKEKYEDKYFEISGKVDTIDSDLSYITIYSNSNEWDTIMCYINNVGTERIVKTLSKGQNIKVKCQITSVGDVLGYTGYITEIVK